MPVIETIKRAFLSYSAKDWDCVNRIAADLRRNGVEVWVDFEGLVPGTPDWEVAIRRAIDQSFALLLVATPDSRQSSYVRSEILLAQSKQLPIYAVWAVGEEWIDSIPLSLAHIHYQDLRGASYDGGLKTLLRELERQRMTLPRHFLYKDYYRRFTDEKGLQLDGRERVWWSRSYSIGSKPIPDGYVPISRKSMFGFWKTSESCDAIAVKPSAYSTAKEVIKEIYREYLKDDYPPFTYGDRWLLREDTLHDEYVAKSARLALHWSYILGDIRPKGGRSSQMIEPPEVYGLANGTRWMISEGRPARPVVVFAAHDIKILQAIREDFKEMLGAIQWGEFVPVDSDCFRSDEYEFVSLCELGSFYETCGEVDMKIFVQNRPTPRGRSRSTSRPPRNRR